MTMRIRRIRIESFRKLAGPVELEGFGNGLTVIAGDNEDGKSTVLEAIRAALFCRHAAKSEYTNSLAPFGTAGARPRVELDFALGDAAYRLRKAFCRKHEAVLVAPGRTFEGEAAEEELCRIFGFPPAKTGRAPKAEEQGVWGLFWVEQGTTFVCERKIGDAGRSTLIGALEDEMGRVLGGEAGRAVIERIRHRCEELFTLTNNVARGDLKLCRERRGEVEKRVEVLEKQAANLREKLTELEGWRAERLQLEREQRLAHAQQTLREVRAEHDRIEVLRRRVLDARHEQQLEHAKLDAAREPWQQRQKLILAAQGAAEASIRVSAELDRARQNHVPLREQLKAADAGVESAKVRYAQAEAAFAAADEALRRSRANANLAAAAEALAKTEAAGAAAVAARAEAAGIAVDDAMMDDLRKLAARTAEARARLDAAETVLEFAPEPGRAVFLGEQAVDPAAPLRITSEITLRLEGFGLLTIRPGGEDLDERQRQAEAATEARDCLLARLGVADIMGAAAAHAQRRERLAAADAEARTVSACAPDGIDALRARVRVFRQELADLAVRDPSPPQDLEAASALLRTAQVERDAARRALTEDQQQRDQITAAWSAADRALIELQARKDAAAQLAVDREQELARARAAAADAALSEVMKTQETNVANAALLLRQAQAELGGADPAAAANRLEAATKALEEVQAKLMQMHEAIRDLESELRTLGQLGVEEELDQARGDLDRARRQAAAIEARAAALRLLHDTLRATEAEARQSFAAPIATRMAPYLSDLFSGSELEFAPDTLQLRLLRRRGIEEPLASLSVGAREQLAVLTRLAFAELLLDRGQPAALILDDALVYSDRKRLRQMQKVLLRAAERLQILVLTCREDDYAGLAPVLRLTERTAAPDPSLELGRTLS